MIGSVVGNYKITEKIGEGGMGSVFKGVDLMLEREVAIKVLRPEFASQPQLVERFRTEAVTLAKLNHPNVATLHSFFRQGEDFFMVMEYVRGEALDNIILRSGALPCDRAISLFCQALEGIGRAHKLGIIHRDIKPANIMLTEDGSIKVMDFGIARVLGTSRMTKQGSIVGTIEYMSPEQVQGLESDARADIYSLGILLYEMLTGRVPFAGDTEFNLMMAQIQAPPPPPRTFAPHIPLYVEQAIMRALAKKPEARFQTVNEFRAALEKGADAQTVIAGAARPNVPPPTRITDMAASGAGDQMKETRLGQMGSNRSPYPQEPYQYAGPQMAAPQASLFSRLTWVHYAGAAVALIILMAVPFIMVVVLKKQASQPPPPVESEPATEARPAQTNEPTTVSVPNQTATQPTDIKPTGAIDIPAGNTAPIDDSPREGKAAKPKQSDAATAAARERARKKAEARRLLEQ